MIVIFYLLQMIVRQQARPVSWYYNGQITSVLMDTHIKQWETHIIASNSIDSPHALYIFYESFSTLGMVQYLVSLLFLLAYQLKVAWTKS
jgi:hypothetical protein